jgi:membrane protein YqaA with SNARE-associated domain
MWKSIRRYHFFYHRKGFYKFLRSITVKFGVIMAVILLALYMFELFTPGISHYFQVYSTAFSKELVLTFFFISETLLGLIPPDLFIVWAKQFASPYAVVTVLAVLSYLAGLLAYYLGVRLVAINKMRQYIHVKFEKQFAMLRSWGGLIIVIAALLPLPFSTMCLGAGMLKFSFRTLAILGVFRIARFFVYAAVLYQVV